MWILNFYCHSFLFVLLSNQSFICSWTLDVVKMSPTWLNIKHLPILLWAFEINVDQVCVSLNESLMCSDNELGSGSCQLSAAPRNAIRTHLKSPRDYIQWMQFLQTKGVTNKSLHGGKSVGWNNILFWCNRVIIWSCLNVCSSLVFKFILIYACICYLSL